MRWYCWKTKPMSLRRRRTASSGGMEARSRPKREMEPEDGWRSPAMTEMSVVFPQPLGPARNVIWPEAAVKSMPRRTWTLVSPSPKWRWICWQWTAGVFMSGRRWLGP